MYDERERRDVVLKVRVSHRERAVIEEHARMANRSVSAFMRERSLGLHLGERITRFAAVDLRRIALALHRLADAAGREENGRQASLFVEAGEQARRLLGLLRNEDPDGASGA